MNDEFLFAEEPEHVEPAVHGSWKVLIVDDEPEVHAVTKLGLSDFSFQGKNLAFASAEVGGVAAQRVGAHAAEAQMLRFVSHVPGATALLVTGYIRRLLPTDQPRINEHRGPRGQAAKRQVINTFDIIDYKPKI